MRKPTLATALLIVAVVTGGCLLPADDGTDDFGAATPGPTEPSSTDGGTSMEDAYSYDTMDDYINAVVPYITSWLDATWPGIPHPEVVFVPNGTSGREGCVDGDGRQARYSSTSYEYCPVEATIYVGQDMVWEFYDRTGDAGPAVGLAHEYGHHVQAELGVPTQRMSSVDVENQADCLAGAWTKYTDEVLKKLEAEDDLKDIDALFPLIGAAEDPDRDHGTTRERAASFQAGFERGAAACDV